MMPQANALASSGQSLTSATNSSKLAPSAADFYFNYKP
jgi:hypothetical protein